MSTFDNTNRGAAFKNNKKEKETQPDYRGPVNIDGVDKEISLWIKESKSGEKFFSIAFSEPYKKTDETQLRSTSEKIAENNDLPF